MQNTVNSQGFEYGVKHFYNEQAGTIVKIICDQLQLDATKVENLLTLGSIYLNHKRQITNIHIPEKQLFRVHTRPRRFSLEVNWLSRIIYEDHDFIVLNKPSNYPSHPSVDNCIENALTQTAKALGKDLFITHRLDTLTEGLIVYAKTPAFVKSFNIQLQERLIDKKYIALVDSKKILSPKLIHYMEPSPRAPKKVHAFTSENWAICELEILSQKIIDSVSLLKINLLTGRTHQIRAQLSEIGAPIIGDNLYGSTKTWVNEGIALRSCELQFSWLGQVKQFTLEDEF